MKSLSTISVALFLAVFLLFPTITAAFEGEKQLKGEHLGELSCDQKSVSIEKLLGAPDSKGKLEYEEAGSTWMQKWIYVDRKVELEMQALKKDSPLKVACITALKGCKLATSRGIKIGDSEEKAQAAYKDFADKTESKPGKSIFVFTPDGCLVLTLEDGKVAGIYLGLLPE